MWRKKNIVAALVLVHAHGGRGRKRRSSKIK